MQSFDTSHHPSGRRATYVDGGIRAELTVTGRPLHKATSQDCWLLAKERQRLEDGTAARIEPERLDRLAAMPSTWPADPTPVANPVDAARVASIPQIRAAVYRKLGQLDAGA